MTGPMDRMRRVVSPVTLLLGVVVFLLPFCAISCNGAGLAPSGDIVSASGLRLAIGGDAPLNCDYVNALGNSISNSFGSSLGGTSSSSSSTSSSSCGSSGAGAGSSSGLPSSSSSGSQKAGPFDGSGSSSTAVHVAQQPIAIIAAVLLLVGAGFALVKGRTGALVAAIAALAAAVALVVLRVTLNSSFSSDIKTSANPSGTSTSSPAVISGIDPATAFQLTWGAGWWLALAAAVIGAIVADIGMADSGPPRMAAVPAFGLGAPQYGGPPPAPPPYGQPPPPYGQPPQPPYGQPPQYGQPLPGQGPSENPRPR